MKTANYFNFSDILFFLLVIMMLLFQTEYMFVKLGVILLIAIINLSKGLYNIRNYSNKIFGILFVIFISGLYCIFSGVFSGQLSDEEMKKQIPFLFIHPLLYYMIIPNMMGDGGVKKMCNIMLIGHILIVSIGLYNIVALFVGLPPIILSEEKEIYMVSDEGVGVSSGTLYQAMLTTPIFFTLGFAKLIKKPLFFVVGIITAVYIVLSSRTALTIIGLASLFIPFVIRYYFHGMNTLNINVKKVVAVIAIMLTVGVVKFWDSPLVQNSYEDFIAHFDSDTDIRFEQRQVLWNAWLESPVFGKGYGASFRTSARGIETDVESMYHAKLATTGMVGLVLFLTYILMILYNLHKKIKVKQSPYYLAPYLGLISCLICSSTNPALASFDRLVGIYMCVACIAASKYYEKRHIEIKRERSIGNRRLQRGFTLI